MTVIVRSILGYLDHSPDDELATFGTAGSEEDMEAVLTIFPVLEVVEDSVREPSEALGADEAGRTIKLAVGVDDLGLGLEPEVAPGTAHTVDIHRAEKREHQNQSKPGTYKMRIYIDALKKAKAFLNATKQ